MLAVENVLMLISRMPEVYNTFDVKNLNVYILPTWYSLLTYIFYYLFSAPRTAIQFINLVDIFLNKNAITSIWKFLNHIYDDECLKKIKKKLKLRKIKKYIYSNL